MLKNEIRGGLGIPPDWATMRGQAKKTNVFADAEKRVFRREKRIVQHPLIRFPSVWLNDIGAAPLFGRILLPHIACPIPVSTANPSNILFKLGSRQMGACKPRKVFLAFTEQHAFRQTAKLH